MRTAETADVARLKFPVMPRTAPGARVFTDERVHHQGMTFGRKVVNHSADACVPGIACTNGNTLLRSRRKRGNRDMPCHFSERHLDRYVASFVGHRNIRKQDTADQMGYITGKRSAFARSSTT